MATVYYKRNSGTNWNANASWTTDNDVTSATNTGTYPKATDTANFKLNSSDCTINATSACAIVDCTGYTGTLTQSANMTTTGNVTFSSGMTFTPNTQYWVQTGSAIITTNGKHFYNFQSNISGGGTITLADDLHGTGLLYIHDNTTFAGSGNIFWSGSFGVYYATICAGRTITFDGTGSLLGHVGQINSNIIINTSGTITFGSASENFFLYGGDGTGTFTYTAGTIAYYDASTVFEMGWGTYSVNGMTIQNAYLHIPYGASPFTSTLTSDAQFNGFTRDWHNNVLACGSHAVTITGDLDNSGSDATPFTGTGTFIFNGTTTLKSNSITFPGNFTINAGKTVHLTSGKTYIVLGIATLPGTSGNHIVLDATTPSSVAYFYPATLGTITYTNATDIDSTRAGTPTQTTLDTQTNVAAWTQYEVRTFNIASPISAYTYRVNVTVNQSGNISAINELALMVGGVTQSSLMTSNTAPSGTASADTEFSSIYPAWKAFNQDGNTNTTWASTNTELPHYLQYTFNNGLTLKTITSYSIQARVTVSVSQMPKTWTLIAISYSPITTTGGSITRTVNWALVSYYPLPCFKP